MTQQKAQNNMEKSATKRSCCLAVVITSLCGLAAEYVNLTAGVDESGIPITGHISVYALSAICIVSVIIYILLSRGLPRRTTRKESISFSFPMMLCGMVSALLLLCDSLITLLTGSGAISLILGLLGILGSVGLFLASAIFGGYLRRNPAPGLVACTYLVVRLMLNFKEWSTDPIILDYFVLLFALAFSLLGIYRCFGFDFGLGRPRQTLFHSCAAIFFCALALLRGLMTGSVSTILTFLGLLLWFPPLLSSLFSAPSDEICQQDEQA